MIMEEGKDDGGCGRDVFFVARTNNLSFPSFPNPIHPAHANCLCIWDPWFVRWLGSEKDGAGPRGGGMTLVKHTPAILVF